MGRWRNGRYLGAPTHGLIQGFPSTMGGVIRVLGMPIDGLINPGGWGGTGDVYFRKPKVKGKGCGGTAEVQPLWAGWGSAAFISGISKKPQIRALRCRARGSPQVRLWQMRGVPPVPLWRGESTGKAPKALNTCARAAELSWGHQSSSASQLVLQVDSICVLRATEVPSGTYFLCRR